MSKNRLIYSILLIVCVIGFWVFENFYTPSHYSDVDEKARAGVVSEGLMPSSTYGDLVHHNFYVLSYSEPHEQAEWVAYTLERSHLTYDDRKRPYFIEDPKVSSKSADWRNYKGSGYDRGHLCPAGDRRFSEHAYNETFYTSNVSPQNKEFNAGIWNRLEMQVRQWCKAYGTLHIITGGVLQGNMREIGEEDVDVPNSFFKVIVRRKEDAFEVLAFHIPHRESKRPLTDFLVSIEELESVSGLDFFPHLENVSGLDFEDKAEIEDWDF